MSARLNNRDHRKLLIIDGKVGFTGGINLADEYINQKVRFGHWKDNAIMLRGDAVWSMTVMFRLCGLCVRLRRYHCQLSAAGAGGRGSRGFVQPYTDNPLDDEPVGGSVYQNLINRANHSVYIMTPYLILDYSMNEALCNAAKTGIDVRIITPHIPDKWYVHTLSRAHYEQLVKCGVKVYEYIPGFIHSKVFAVDGQYATVGTINLDYQAVSTSILKMACSCMGQTVWETFTGTLPIPFAVSQQITLKDCQAASPVVRLMRAVLRLLAPLM